MAQLNSFVPQRGEKSKNIKEIQLVDFNILSLESRAVLIREEGITAFSILAVMKHQSSYTPGLFLPSTEYSVAP